MPRRLKPTQCALWLRPAGAAGTSAIFFIAASTPSTTGLENAYARLIGALVKRSGLVVLVGLIVSALGILGNCPPADGLYSQ